MVSGLSSLMLHQLGSAQWTGGGGGGGDEVIEILVGALSVVGLV